MSAENSPCKGCERCTVTRKTLGDFVTLAKVLIPWRVKKKEDKATKGEE